MCTKVNNLRKKMCLLDPEQLFYAMTSVQLSDACFMRGYQWLTMQANIQYNEYIMFYIFPPPTETIESEQWWVWLGVDTPQPPGFAPVEQRGPCSLLPTTTAYQGPQSSGRPLIWAGIVMQLLQPSSFCWSAAFLWRLELNTVNWPTEFSSCICLQAVRCAFLPAIRCTCLQAMRCTFSQL